MKYLIIGLGIYGSNLAIDLAKMGHEVIGADIRPALVDSIKDNISTAYIIDSTDEASLSLLPLKNVDLVIVAIGENFGASVKTVALLKSMGVKHIYARAIDPLHEAILEGFGIDRIVTPEQRAARDLVSEMQLGSDVEVLKVDDRNFVMKFSVPSFMVGMTYDSLELEQNFKLRLISVTRARNRRNVIGADVKKEEMVYSISDGETVLGSLTVSPDDCLTMLGTFDAYRKLSRSIKQSGS